MPAHNKTPELPRFRPEHADSLAQVTRGEHNGRVGRIIEVSNPEPGKGMRQVTLRLLPKETEQVIMVPQSYASHFQYEGRRCVHCGHLGRAEHADLEVFGLKGNVACKDPKICQARQNGDLPGVLYGRAASFDSDALRAEREPQTRAALAHLGENYADELARNYRTIAQELRMVGDELATTGTRNV